MEEKNYSVVLSGILICATIAKATRMLRCSMKEINEEIAAVLHLDIGVPRAAVIAPGETDLSGDLPISHCRVETV